MKNKLLGNDEAKTLDACKRHGVTTLALPCRKLCLVGGLQASPQNNVSFVQQTLTRLSFSVARSLTKKSLIHILLLRLKPGYIFSSKMSLCFCIDHSLEVNR
jgi:hypothetical protein